MSEYNGQSRRHLLAISSLVNDVSVNPIQKHCLTSNYHHHHCQQRNTSYTCQLYISPPSNYDYFTQYSPMFTGSSSPVDNDHSRQSSIVEPPDLWNHSTTGMHQALNGNIVISSLSKAKRKRIMTHQYNRLVQVFQITDTPSSEIRRQLAEELDMTKREVQVWFQNRRAKVNRDKSRQHSKDISQTSQRRDPYYFTTKLFEAPIQSTRSKC